MHPSIILVSFVVLALVWYVSRKISRKGEKPWRAPGLVSAANSFYAAMQRHVCSVRRTVDSAVETRCLLFTKGDNDTSIDIAAAEDYPLGCVDNLLSAGEAATLDLLGRGPTKVLKAAGAISPGDRVYTADGGKVQALPTDPGTYWLVGRAISGADAADDYIEVDDGAPQQLVIVAAQTSAAVTTANASDLATAEALANALKTTVNALVADVAAIKAANGI